MVLDCTSRSYSEIVKQFKDISCFKYKLDYFCLHGFGIRNDDGMVSLTNNCCSGLTDKSVPQDLRMHQHRHVLSRYDKETCILCRLK